MNTLFEGENCENGPFNYHCKGQACTSESTHVELPFYLDPNTIIKCVDTPGLNEDAE